MENAKRAGAPELLGFLNGSPTAFHAAANCAALLEGSGFVELREGERWKLERGGKYFLRRGGSSIAVFEIGRGGCAEGFRIIGAHTDSPGFKLKPGNAIVTDDGYVKLNTEGYGGAILSTWFDRPLSIAGRVITKGASGFAERLVDIEKPALIIPNLCMHFHRDVNDGFAINRQVDMLPLLGFARESAAKGDYVRDLVGSGAGIEKGDILDYDLFLYESDRGRIMGPNDEFISASRLDNLWMVFAGIMAMINSGECQATKVFAAFDAEEVGSVAVAGADSSFLGGTLRRVCAALGMSEEDAHIAASNSAAVSADCAHAVHPNYADRHDPGNRPVLGGGPAIKYSATQRYATNARTAAMFASLCKSAGISCQNFANRSDVAGGSTIGPSMSSLTSIPAVDVGIPILAMHSIREFGCLADGESAIAALSLFFAAEHV